MKTIDRIINAVRASELDWAHRLSRDAEVDAIYEDRNV